MANFGKIRTKDRIFMGFWKNWTKDGGGGVSRSIFSLVKIV